jgi:preprotein translocase subunit YajC
LNIPQLLADAATLPSTQPATGTQRLPWYADPSQLLLPLLAVFFVFIMFSSSRTKKKEQKHRDDMLKNMKRGDRVMTAGGMIGSVVEVRETEVVLKVDETTNTKIKFSRDAIKRVIPEDESTAK